MSEARRRALEAIEVLGERKGDAVERARHLVDRVAVEEAAIEHRHARLGGVDGLAVDPHERARRVHARLRVAPPTPARRSFHTSVSASMKIFLRHLRLADAAVDEDDRHLLDAQARA